MNKINKMEHTKSDKKRIEILETEIIQLKSIINLLEQRVKVLENKGSQYVHPPVFGEKSNNFPNPYDLNITYEILII